VQNNLPLDVGACSTVYSFKPRLMLFWIVKGLYKSVMTFFPLPTGLLTFSVPSGCIAKVHTFLCLVTLTNAFDALKSLL
jgi:hypothetical protein